MSFDIKNKEYQVQHNGKGKQHLLDSNDDPLCGSTGTFLFTTTTTVSINNDGELVENYGWGYDIGLKGIDHYCK